jgi:type 1 glutamine amidotransferase
MNRRDLMRIGSAALLGCASPSLAGAAGDDAKKRKVLYFTRSAGVEHEVVKQSGAGPSHSGKNLIEMGRRSGFEVECTKDGRVFDGDLSQYDAIAFYTSGDLTQSAKDGSPPMTAAGKRKLLDTISSGKGFAGFHSAADTFHSKGPLGESQAEVDPYIAMLGGESLAHGAAQEASLLATSQFLIRNIGVPSQGLSFTEEWFTFKNFSQDLHVLLAQETRYMRGDAYRRPDYPSTWVRMHGRGRVFYTSLGHREDVWTNPFFHAIAQAGLGWVMGGFDYDITPNIGKVTPQANQLKA